MTALLAATLRSLMNREATPSVRRRLPDVPARPCDDPGFAGDTQPMLFHSEAFAEDLMDA